MKMEILLIILLAVVVSGKPFDSVSEQPKCGYNSCHAVDEKKINVHIVAHSHDDVGWLKTVDEYYYGEVQEILTSVVNALMEDPNRRFIQVETAFFYMWWNQQTQTKKAVVKELVNEGRLEIVNGAWSMNDEATVHYQSTIDQYTLGLRLVQDELGICARPKVSWQIDTFGHSREHASLVAQFGMDSLFFARFDYRDRAKRLSEKNMEMLWTGSANLGSESNIFTSALYHHYNAPPNFCFDIICKDDPIVDDTESFEYNIETKVKEFASFIEEQSSYYATPNILITMGDDFYYQAASKVYVNLDKLMAGFKKFTPKVNGKEINLIYSTPSCYTKAVHDYIQNKNITLDVKTDDFFPYADTAETVWTGYFTSRAGSKRFERVSNNLLQVAKQLGAIAGRPYEDNLALSHAMGVMQHHDAITGTEADYVQQDYHRQLTKAIDKVTKNAGIAFSTILGLSSFLNFVSCPLTNVSVCSISGEDEYNILVYNPLARKIFQYVHIPILSTSYDVQGPTGEMVESHSTSLIDYFNECQGSLGATLIFKAEDLPPLGYKVYKIKRTNMAKAERKGVEMLDQMGFEKNYVNFHLTTGYLKSMTLNGVTLPVTQQFFYYESSRNSNAYIFSPNSEDRTAKPLTLRSNTVLINDGNLVREVKQSFQEGINQIIRIYPDEDYIEFDWLIGSQDVSGAGIEIVTRYETNIENNDEFYTDSNGREMIKRKRNYRPTYNYTDEEPQAGNYYPVNTRIVIKNDTYEFAVLTDRSEGGTSLASGQVELMLTRQIPNSLDEYECGRPVEIRGTHYVTFGPTTNGIGGRTMAAVERGIVQRKQLQPWLFFTKDDVSDKERSFLSGELPPNVHFLTLESWGDDTVLIRLEHMLEKDEDPTLSQEVTVNMTGLFTSFNIHTMKEYTLAANIPLEESERLSWSQIKPENKTSPLSIEYRLKRDETDLSITLAPMQIRTFIATVSPIEY